MKSSGVAKAAASAVALAFAVTTSPFAQKPVDKDRPQDKVAAAKQAPGANAAGAEAPTQRHGETVAKLRQVEGNVLVSQESGLASAEDSLRLEDRSRVITTANAKVIVVYDDGCEVTLEPNQRLEIRTDKECAERVVQADTLFKEPAGLAFAAGGTGLVGGATAAALAGVGGGAIVGTAGISGLAALLISRQDTAVSPS